MPSVIPGLKASLLDPVPEVCVAIKKNYFSKVCLMKLSHSCSSSPPAQVRTVSAKALGAMVKGMGESCFDDLLPWLMETLASEQSSVDRSGAAQGHCLFILSPG